LPCDFIYIITQGENKESMMMRSFLLSSLVAAAAAVLMACTSYQMTALAEKSNEGKVSTKSKAAKKFVCRISK